jgi:GntR family transcriptional regulator
VKPAIPSSNVEASRLLQPDRARPDTFVLNPESPVPLYHQLRQALETSWRARFTPEDELPTEQDIANEFHVSRITVRRALDELIADAVVRRPRPRARLRLSPARVRQQLNRLRGFFSDDALAAGHHPCARVLGVEEGVWPEANRLLQLPDDATCYRISRLHESGGRPLGHQLSFVSCASCPDLTHHDLSTSLLHLLESQYGRRAASAEQRLAAREATKDEAALLQLPRNCHVFEVDRLSFDEHGRPIEYFVSVLDIARFEFHTRVNAEPGG